MQELFGYFDEEEEEEEEEDWPTIARLEVIEYILRRYGNLAAGDIAKILGCKVSDVRYLLRRLESSGRVERLKLGRNHVWISVEHSHGLMYY